jgi:hypothetical protein
MMSFSTPSSSSTAPPPTAHCDNSDSDSSSVESPENASNNLVKNVESLTSTSSWCLDSRRLRREIETIRDNRYRDTASQSNFGFSDLDERN